jgi:hypothetical protein
VPLAGASLIPVPASRMTVSWTASRVPSAVTAMPSVVRFSITHRSTETPAPTSTRMPSIPDPVPSMARSRRTTRVAAPLTLMPFVPE